MTPEQWRAAKRIFQDLADRTAQERSAMLDERCAEDDDLRREVEKLLRNHDRAGSFIESPAVERAVDWPGPTDHGLEGTALGRYRVLGKLGQGGMGVVYLAERADREYRQQVAVKLIKAGMGTDFLVARFRQERQILAHLDHPAIARLLDGGVAPDGRPFLVMEYVEGVPIDRYCADHGLDLHERLSLFRRVCDAVQYAHRNLVIHRDLKPSNILVTREGNPKLLDFGTAKLLDPVLAADTGAHAPTVTGLRLMTPDYASPEQVKAESVTTASDVYALGMVLYELVTGQRAYKVESPFSPAGMRVVCEHEPARPSTALAASLPRPWRRRLAGDLDNIVLMALRKEPERRYASVEQLSEDIRRTLAQEPVSARRDTFTYRTGKFVRRHRAAVAVAALGVLALVAGLLGTTWQARRALAEKQRAQEHLARAEEVSGFLLELFQVSDPHESGPDSRNHVVERILDEGAARIQRELEHQPQLRATLMDTMGLAFLHSGNERRAVRLFEQAVNIKERELGGDHVDVATSLHYLGRAYLQLRELDKAEAVLRRALAIQDLALGPDHEAIARSRDDLGRVYQLRGEVEEAERLLRQSVHMLRGLPGVKEPVLAESLNNLAAVLFDQGRVGEAEALIHEALGLRRRFHGGAHPDVANGLYQVAALAYSKKDWAKAEALFNESLDMHREIFGPEHWSLAHCLEGLASVAMGRGQYDQAEALYQRTLALRRKTRGPEHPEVVVTLGNLAALRTTRGDHAGALALYGQTLELGRRVFGDTHPRVERWQRDLDGVESRLQSGG